MRPVPEPAHRRGRPCGGILRASRPVTALANRREEVSPADLPAACRQFVRRSLAAMVYGGASEPHTGAHERDFLEHTC